MSTTEATAAAPATPKPTVTQKMQTAYGRFKGKVHAKLAHHKPTHCNDSMQPTATQPKFSHPKAGSPLTDGLSAPAATSTPAAQ